MKTPYLLGIITVLLFGSFATTGMIAHAGTPVADIIRVVGPEVTMIQGTSSSIAECPPTHQVIGGGLATFKIDGFSTKTSIPDIKYNLFSQPSGPNGWTVLVLDAQYDTNQYQFVLYSAYVMCAQFNFPMGMSMIGGELLDIDTMALFVGAIGVNPVITGLVAITMGGVAAQAIWYFNQRRRKSENS